MANMQHVIGQNIIGQNWLKLGKNLSVRVVTSHQAEMLVLESKAEMDSHCLSSFLKQRYQHEKGNIS